MLVEEFILLLSISALVLISRVSGWPMYTGLCWQSISECNQIWLWHWFVFNYDKSIGWFLLISLTYGMCLSKAWIVFSHSGVISLKISKDVFVFQCQKPFQMYLNENFTVKISQSARSSIDKPPFHLITTIPNWLMQTLYLIDIHPFPIFLMSNAIRLTHLVIVHVSLNIHSMKCLNIPFDFSWHV